MRRILCLVMLCCLAVFSGCGGGNNGSVGMTGTLRVTSGQTSGEFASTVTFTISYTNPYVSSVGGVPVNYAVWVDGVLIDNVATNFNDTGTNSSSFTVSYVIPKASTAQSVRCQANSSALVSSSVQLIGAFAALSVTPFTQQFEATDLVGSTKTYTISGGSGNYSAVSDTPSLVTVSVSGGTLTAVRAGTGPSIDPVIITVTDTDTLETAQVQATLIAIP